MNKFLWEVVAIVNHDDDVDRIWVGVGRSFREARDALNKQLLFCPSAIKIKFEEALRISTETQQVPPM